MASDKETAPLLPRAEPMETSQGGWLRVSRVQVAIIVTATVGTLALFERDFVENTSGGLLTRQGFDHLDVTQQNSNVDDTLSLALSPTFVNYINSQNKTWVARIPKGWENARHSDLKRVAGGRLSTVPRSKLWQTSEFASTAEEAATATKGEGTVHLKTGPRSKLWETSKYSSSVVTPTSNLGQYRSDRGNVGGFIEDFIGGPQPVGGIQFDPESWGLPAYFDSRKKWPQCAALIGGGRDQGNCGSCWAMAPAEVMSDRLCIQSGGKRNVELSPYELLACATMSAQGCDGGESTVAYEFARTEGIVSGSKNGDTRTCAPYPFAACHHPCDVYPTPSCPSSCSNGLDMEQEKVRVRTITHCPSFDFKCVAKEIFNNGPVSSYAGDIYEEFYAYSHGVYRESPDIAARGENHGGHVIKVIGWGKDEDSGGYYWIIVNSWLNWGHNGIGRVAVGEVGIGAGVEAAVMDI